LIPLCSAYLECPNTLRPRLPKTPLRHLETLAVDPSQSPEQEAKITEELFKAVGKVSRAAETLNSEDVQMKARLYQARANVANAQAQQHQQSMDILNPFGTLSKADQDKDDTTRASEFVISSPE
jgi:hypothetical protein